MADYEVSAAYLDTLLRALEKAGELGVIVQGDARLGDLAKDPYVTAWHPAELLESLGEGVVQAFGPERLAALTGEALTRRFGNIVLPMISSAVKAGPGAVLSKLDAVIKVALRGVTVQWAADANGLGGVLTVRYPRPVAGHVAESWRGIVGYVLTATGRTGSVEAVDRSPDGQVLTARVRFAG
jgi:hypothetical protein